MAVVGGIVANVGTGLEIINDVVEGKTRGQILEKIVIKFAIGIASNKIEKISKNDSERLVNETVISILDKTIDDARNNKKGPYKEKNSL